jgi:hypothetical protein
LWKRETCEALKNRALAGTLVTDYYKLRQLKILDVEFSELVDFVEKGLVCKTKSVGIYLVDS